MQSVHYCVWSMCTVCCVADVHCVLCGRCALCAVWSMCTVCCLTDVHCMLSGTFRSKVHLFVKPCIHTPQHGILINFINP